MNMTELDISETIEIEESENESTLVADIQLALIACDIDQLYTACIEFAVGDSNLTLFDRCTRLIKYIINPDDSPMTPAMLASAMDVVWMEYSSLLNGLRRANHFGVTDAEKEAIKKDKLGVIRLGRAIVLKLGGKGLELLAPKAMIWFIFHCMKNKLSVAQLSYYPVIFSNLNEVTKCVQEARSCIITCCNKVEASPRILLMMKRFLQISNENDDIEHPYDPDLPGNTPARPTQNTKGKRQLDMTINPVAKKLKFSNMEDDHPPNEDTPNVSLPGPSTAPSLISETPVQSGVYDTLNEPLDEYFEEMCTGIRNFDVDWYRKLDSWNMFKTTFFRNNTKYYCYDPNNTHGTSLSEPVVDVMARLWHVANSCSVEQFQLLMCKMSVRDISFPENRLTWYMGKTVGSYNKSACLKQLLLANNKEPEMKALEKIFKPNGSTIESAVIQAKKFKPSSICSRQEKPTETWMN